MANALLTTSGVADAYTQLTAWLVSASAGGMNLTLYDTVSSTDKVYVLPGESGAGRLTLYLRVSQGKQERAPGSAGPQHHAEGIVLELYSSWNTGTGTGGCATGRVGRRFMLSQHNADRIGAYLPTKRMAVMAPETSVQQLRNTQGATWEFDGRNVLSWNNVNPTQAEYQTLNYINFVTGRADGRAQNQNACTVINPATGKQETFYFVRQDQQATSISFSKFDWGNQTHYALADAPWALGGGVGYYVTGWDGNDRIYVIRMYQVGANDFAYYTISTNTWTSLPSFTSTAVNFDFNYAKGGQRLHHVPASLSGYSEDCFYYLCPNWGAETTWFRYKITTGAWETSGGSGFPNLPFPKYQYGHNTLFMDSEAGANGSFYYTASDNFQQNVRMWRFDFVSTTWQAEDTNANAVNNGTPWTGDNESHHMLPIHQHCGKLMLPLASSNLVLQCVGNKDYVAVMATWVAPNTSPGPSYQMQRYAYAGYVNSTKHTEFFAVASALTPGVNQTIALTTSIATKVNVGDTFRIYNHSFNGLPDNRGQTWTPGGGELVTIVAITDSTHVVVDRITTAYNAPTDAVYLTQDGMNAVVGNDCGWFVRMRGGTGAYRADGEADLVYVTPSIPAALTGVGADGISQISGMALYQKWTSANYGGGQGELYGIFVSHASGMANDSFNIDGHPYTVFVPFLVGLAKDTRFLVIGPTDA